MLLKEEQLAGKLARETSLLLQQDVNKHVEQQTQLKIECDSLAEDLQKQIHNLNESKVSHASTEELKQAVEIMSGKPYLR